LEVLLPVLLELLLVMSQQRGRLNLLQRLLVLGSRYRRVLELTLRRIQWLLTSR
jgi:hypothetical protein